MPVDPPISMGCSTQPGKTMESSMASSGTTSKVLATPCAPPPWWFGPWTFKGIQQWSLEQTRMTLPTAEPLSPPDGKKWRDLWKQHIGVMQSCFIIALQPTKIPQHSPYVLMTGGGLVLKKLAATIFQRTTGSSYSARTWCLSVDFLSFCFLLFSFIFSIKDAKTY